MNQVGKMREGVVTVLKIYNVWGRTRIDVDYGDGGVYIIDKNNK